MRVEKVLVAGVSATVFVVFCTVAALLSTSLVTSALLVVVGALMSAGSWMLLTSLNMPSRVTAIDLEALEGADPTLREAAEELDEMLGRMDAACSGDDPHGIAAESERLRELVASMAELVALPEFSSAGSGEDRRLVLSLASSWLPGAWDQLVTNVRYLGFGGRASARARRNVTALDGQCDSVAGALDKVRTNIVADASARIETGSDYLRQRLGHLSRELSLDVPDDGSAAGDGASRD